MIYSGFIKLNGAEIAFQFDENVLILYPEEALFRDLTMKKDKNGAWYMSVEGKPLAEGSLIGKVYGQSTVIHFFYDPFAYDTTINDFIETEIRVHIRYFIKYNRNISYPVKNASLIYKSLQFHRFLNLIPQYEISSDWSNGLCGDIRCNTDSTRLESTGSIDGMDLTIKPSCSCTWGGTKFFFHPALLFNISEIQNEQQLLKLYSSIIKFVQYIFMRKDIFPDSFIIEFENMKNGELHSCFNKDFVSNSEDCDMIWRDAIPWSIIYKHAISILDGIYSEQWYLEDIPKAKEDRLRVNNSTISKVAAGFEHEFSISFPNGLPIHSEKRIIAETEVESELKPLLDNAHGKKRDIYKGFMSHIRNDALADKIEYCFTQYEQQIKWLKSKIAPDFTAEKIADFCANIRNDIDHGDKLMKIDSDVATVYILLRALNYAMQLKRMGYETDDINAAIVNLYYFKGIAP